MTYSHWQLNPSDNAIHVIYLVGYNDDLDFFSMQAYWTLTRMKDMYVNIYTRVFLLNSFQIYLSETTSLSQI